MNDRSSDPRIVAALTEYQRRLDAGERPTIDEVVGAHPEIAGELRGCLEALAFMHGAVRPVARHSIDAWLDSENPPAIIGDFRLLREVGRGGMGVVYEAEQISLQRSVALKILPMAVALDDRARRRFQRESQAAASLQHPHIVPVFAVGEDQGVHFYAMQFIDGESLSQVVKRRRATRLSRDPQAAAVTRDTSVDHDQPTAVDTGPDVGSTAVTERPVGNMETPHADWLAAADDRDYFAAVARATIQAAEALQHAHEQGILHRDIKPGNLLLDQGGHIWVADFGLARLPGSDLTGTADVMGTLRYMPPEQAAGGTVSIDARCDVYSLGATLYELLTLRPAFAADTQEELLHQVLNSSPVAPRQHCSTLPVDLETIVLKAMAREPAERYVSARQVADDLHRFLTDQPILAKPPSLGQRFGKWLWRNRYAAGITGIASVLAVIVGIIGLAMATLRIDEQRRHAQAALRRESSALKEATQAKTEAVERLNSERQMAYLHAVTLAHMEIENGNLVGARNLLESCPPELRQLEWNYASSLCSGELRTFSTGTDRILDLEPLPSGELLTRTSQGMQTWSPTNSQPVANQPWKETWAGFGQLRRSLSGRSVVGWRSGAIGKGAAGLSLTLFDPRSGEKTGEIATPFPSILDCELSADGMEVCARGPSGELAIWSVQTPAQSPVICTENISVFKPIPGQPWLAVITSSREVATLDLATGQRIRTLIGPSDSELTAVPKTLACHPFLPLVAVGLSNGNVQIVDLHTARMVAQFQQEGLGKGILQFSPDGLTLAAAQLADDSIRFWNWRTETLEGELRTGQRRLRTIAFSASGDLLYSLSDQSQLAVWRVAHSCQRRLIGKVSGEVGVRRLAGLAVTAKRVAFQLNEATVLYDRAEPNVVRQIDSDTPVVALQLDETADRLIQVRLSGVSAVDLKTGERTKIPLQHPVTISAPVIPTVEIPREVRFQNGLMAVLSRETAFLTGPGDSGPRSVLSQYSLRTGELLGRIQANKKTSFMQVAVSPDGRRFAATVFGGDLLAWNNLDRRTVITQEAWRLPTTSVVSSLQYSSDGRFLGIAQQDGKVRIVDTTNGSEVSQLTIPVRTHCWMAFDSKADRIAVATSSGAIPDGEVRIWDVRRGLNLVRIPFAAQVICAAFSPDNRELVVGDASGQLWIVSLTQLSAETKFANHQLERNAWRAERVERAMAEESYRAAELHLRELVAAEPDHLEWKQQLLRCQTQLGSQEPIEESTFTLLESLPARSKLPTAFRLSANLLEKGDTATHQQLCRSLFQQVTADVPNSTASMTYRLAVFAPGATDDLEQFIQLVEARFSDDSKDSKFALGFLRGMAHFRAGRFEAAKRDLEPLLDQHRVPSQSYPIVNIYLAMTAARLGDVDAAKTAFAAAEREFVGNKEVRVRQRVVHLVDYHYPLLRKEAEQLMKSP